MNDRLNKKKNIFFEKNIGVWFSPGTGSAGTLFLDVRLPAWKLLPKERHFGC